MYLSIANGLTASRGSWDATEKNQRSNRRWDEERGSSRDPAQIAPREEPRAGVLFNGRPSHFAPRLLQVAS